MYHTYTCIMLPILSYPCQQLFYQGHKKRTMDTNKSLTEFLSDHFEQNAACTSQNTKRNSNSLNYF